ncbi:hypothetical protein T4C_5371 [Trichinella pseudospiralis]|uniref:Uncharacterized protein n=1 Tax=Trichinella pseudospiralis TaxID=6337 RepID=A0A0V1IZI6_TRIPS|nr:hypothetical protein T4C_11125 [Trichinella pseudospiralis]KRZ25778.1 hypothetical protein T4C_13871 [Trichinella pseudospiralis]KRZ28008.1 hypothetical protein T4C_5371 [Trichinella pseudospiralis]
MVDEILKGACDVVTLFLVVLPPMISSLRDHHTTCLSKPHLSIHTEGSSTRNFENNPKTFP